MEKPIFPDLNETTAGAGTGGEYDCEMFDGPAIFLSVR